MKRYFLLFGLLIAVLSSCKKGSTFNAAAQAATDDAIIQAYFKTFSITNAVKDASGLYYQIVTPGTGAHPTANSNVTVGFTLSLTDGTQLENKASTYLQLPGLIQAWQIGLPKIADGGNIILYVPSALGYGTTGNGNDVPANTVIIYNVTLQGFN